MTHVTKVLMQTHNVGVIHDRCVNERLQKWQAENKETKISSGAFIQKKFTQGHKAEHMWIKVTKEIGKGIYEGTLNNDPLILAGTYTYGQAIRFERSEIEQHMDSHLN